MPSRGVPLRATREIGTRVPESMGYYSDIDMIVKPGTGYTHRDGTPYPKAPRRGA